MNQVQAPYIKREICAPFLLGERSGREDQATYHLSLIPQIYVQWMNTCLHMKDCLYHELYSVN